MFQQSNTVSFKQTNQSTKTRDVKISYPQTLKSLDFRFAYLKSSLDPPPILPPNLEHFLNFRFSYPKSPSLEMGTSHKEL